MIVRWVQARGWPWQTDLEVRDDAGLVLALHEARDSDLQLGRTERAHAALRRLTDSQDQLRRHYASHDQVRLELDPTVEEQLDELLGRYEIDPQLMDWAAWPRLLAALHELEPLELWHLIADWYDEYEVGTQEAGTSRSNPPGWMQLTHPDQSCYWQWMAGKTGASSAWSAFEQHYTQLELVSVTMYDLLHWALALRTEFADREPSGLEHLGLCTSLV